MAVQDLEKYLEGLFMTVIEQYFKGYPVSPDGIIDFLRHGFADEVWDKQIDICMHDHLAQKILTRLTRKKMLQSHRPKKISYYMIRNDAHVQNNDTRPAQDIVRQ